VAKIFRTTLSASMVASGRSLRLFERAKVLLLDAMDGRCRIHFDFLSQPLDLNG